MSREFAVSRDVILLFFLVAVSALFIALFSRELHFDYRFSDYFTLIPVLFGVHIAETALVMVLGVVLLRGSIFLRLIFYGLLVFYVAVVFIQYYAFYFGREFVSQVALENIDHVALLLTPGRIGVAALAAVFLLCLVALLEKVRGRGNYRAVRNTVLTGTVLLGGVTVLSGQLLPQPLNDRRDACFERNSLEYIGPLTALYEAAFVHGSVLGSENEFPKLSMKQVVDVERFGFSYDARKEYPFIKEKIHETPPPFGAGGNGKAKPNVIVIFTEGFSARSVGIYGSKYADLTPHIDEFGKSAMRFENYYNHTAATYRGLHGQLCSIYPEFGGGAWMKYFDSLAERQYFCLNHVFEKEGYETIFLDSHHKDHMSRVDEMITNLGFDQVHTGEVLAAKYLDNQEPLIKDAYSDKQFFTFLIGFLKERERQEESGKPFMTVLYNFGTHAMLPVTADGVRYGDGINEPLNTIHSYDAAFGLFWEYFKSSPFADNTIVVLTADHSHYPEKPYVDAFEGPDYQPYFVDRIPHFIYDPTRELPRTYDVGYATSIDFAPSLVHYLGLPNVRNSFIGSSVYERGENEYTGMTVAFYGSKNYFFIDHGKVYRYDFPETYKDKLKSVRRFMSIVKRVELKNKIWDGKG